MKFLRENSYRIVRLFVIQIGMTIFGLVVTTAASKALPAASAGAGKLAVSVFAILFYLFILYTTAWEYGASYQSRAAGSPVVNLRLYGLKIALVANALNLVLAALMLIGLFRLSTDSSIFIGLYGTAQLLAGLFESMYLGLIQAILPAAGNMRYVIAAVCYLFAVVPPILTVQIGCALGRRNIRLTPAKPPKLD